MLELKQKTQITEAVREWIMPNNKDRSGAELARKAGINEAYVSRIKAGEYEMPGSDNRTSPIKDTYFYKIAQAVGLNLDKVFDWNTTQRDLVQKWCRKAQNKKLRVLVSSPSGVGKTDSLENYAYNNDRVLYIKCTKNMGTRDMLDLICRKLNISEYLVGNYAKLEAIRKELIGRKGWLIIIDEVENVKLGIWDSIKEISDFTEGQCGLMVAGIDIISFFNKMSDKKRIPFSALKRRFFPNRVELHGLDASEIIELCVAEGCAKKVANLIGALVERKELTDYDMLSNYLGDVVEYQDKKDRTMTAEEFIDMFGIRV
jgi:DNA transposition AAA+ family ATPase